MMLDGWCWLGQQLMVVSHIDDELMLVYCTHTAPTKENDVCVQHPWHVQSQHECGVPSVHATWNQVAASTTCANASGQKCHAHYTGTMCICLRNHTEAHLWDLISCWSTESSRFVDVAGCFPTGNQSSTWIRQRWWRLISIDCSVESQNWQR